MVLFPPSDVAANALQQGQENTRVPLRRLAPHDACTARRRQRRAQPGPGPDNTRTKRKHSCGAFMWSWNSAIKSPPVNHDR